MISDILADDSIEPETVAAALAKMCQRDGTLFLDESQPEPKHRNFDDNVSSDHQRKRGAPSGVPVPLREFPDLKMMRYRLAVGRRDMVKPGQIVGAIANEANLASKYIGEIAIYDTFSTVDLPDGMPPETMEILARARVCGRALELREYTVEPPKHHRFSDRGRPGADRFDRNSHRDADERSMRNFDDDGRSYNRKPRRDGFNDRRPAPDFSNNRRSRPRPSFGGGNRRDYR